MSFVLVAYRDVERDTPSERVHPPVRLTYRTTRVLEAVCATPRSSNRAIADAAGLRDEGQTSKLLSRLARRGLIENRGLGAAYGEPNEWLLTDVGQRTLEIARRASVRSPGRPRGRAVRGAA